MAAEAYYFAFSIIFVLGLILYIGNMVYLRAKGKTIFGQEYKPGTPEYKRVIRIASNRNLTLAAMLTLAFAANLANSISRIVRLDATDKSFIFIFIPTFIVLISVIMFFKMRSTYGGMKKHD